MREILFCGKRIDNGEWAEGYYFKMNETTYAFAEDYEKYPVSVHHYIVLERMSDWGLPNRAYFLEVDPETVCQYTGLSDKNGRKIFEGDIVKRYNDYIEEYDYGVVKYGDFNCSCCSGVYGWYFENGDIRRCNEYEVCGNIFDNPELIRKEQIDYEPPFTEEQRQEAVDRFFEEQEKFRNLWKSKNL